MARGRDRGTTLVELMVGIALALIVTVVVSYTFLGSRATYRSQDDSAAMQESARLAIETIARQLRQGGYDLYMLTATNNSLDTRCRLAAGWIVTGAGAGVAVARRLEGANATGFGASDEIAVAFCGSGRLVTRPADGTIVDCRGRPIAADQVGRSSLSVRRLDGTGGLPLVRDALGNARSGLVCDTLDGQPLVPVVLGVEAMQLVYGVDSTADGVIDQWRTAANVAAGDWPNVLAVRASLVIAGNQYSNAAASAATYDHFGGAFAGDAGASVAPAGAEQRRPRRLVEVTVALRNTTDLMSLP
jgi:type IV pilus assembly protein PilW